MTLTLHIVRKDLSRLRWWLVGWVFVLLLPIAVGINLLANNPFGRSTWDLPETLQKLWGLEVLIGYLLTILVVQNDPVIGTQHFWLTRPISRGRLLRAKALGIAVVLGLIPIVVSLPWWIWCQLAMGQVAVAALDMIVLGALVAIPAALIATVTETFSRAMLWTLVLAAAIATTMGMFVLASGSGIKALIGAGVLAGVFTAAIMLGVTVRLFFTRRRTWRLLIAAAAFPVLLVGSFAAGRQWASRPVAPREMNAARAEGVTVQFANARTHRRETSAEESERVQWVVTAFDVAGMPDGAALSLSNHGGHSWRWNGITLEREASRPWSPMVYWPEEILGLRSPAHDPETDQWHAERARQRGSPPLRAASPGRFAIDAGFKRSIVARMEAEPPAYQAKLWFELLRPEMLFELPLTAGRWSARDGRTVRVASASRGPAHDPAAMAVTIVETSPANLANILHSVAHPYDWWREVSVGQLLAAVNRQRQEFVGVRGDGERSLVINGVRVGWRIIRVEPGVVRRGERWVLRPGWLDGVSLALVRFNVDAQFKREVRVDRFTFEPARRAGNR